MKITRIDAQWVRIPLPKPIGWSVKTIQHRHHVLVRVRTDAGIDGVGFCLQDVSARPALAAVEDLLAPLVIGEDPRDIQRLWDRMFRQTVRAGRRGAVLHALSAIDIALWDIAAKERGLPLYKVLGACREEVPCYASGGYYHEGGLAALEAEVAAYVAQGFQAVKMKIGRLSPKGDAERVHLVRRTIGPGIKLMVDANQAWTEVTAALEAVRHFEACEIAWLEEPFPVDMLEAHARLRQRIAVPIATGEVESTRWGFQALIAAHAVDILQPDATVCGGVSELLRIAALASAHGLPVAPHYHWDLHVHLVAALPEATIVEKFVGTDVKSFDLILKEPLEAVRGMLRPPERPGHGVEFDEAKVAALLVK